MFSMQDAPWLKAKSRGRLYTRLSVYIYDCRLTVSTNLELQCSFFRFDKLLYLYGFERRGLFKFTYGWIDRTI